LNPDRPNVQFMGYFESIKAYGHLDLMSSEV
jgi:hypothetical protein